MSGVEGVQRALHEVWLAMHLRRREDRSATVDSFYAGILAAEHAIHDYCRENDLPPPWTCTHEHAPPTAAPSPDREPEPTPSEES